MPLPLRQLEAFHAVVVNGSMTKAATSLNISQPAVSRLVASL
ncbi:MAG: DNA-binding transcriptional LysR family regulator, partial [Gammaproteobacteria bacterium]